MVNWLPLAEYHVTVCPSLCISAGCDLEVLIVDAGSAPGTLRLWIAWSSVPAVAVEALLLGKVLYRTAASTITASAMTI